MIGNEDDSGQLDSAPVKSNCVKCGGKCGMSFCQKQQHDELKKTHGGGRLFKCQFYKRSFIQRQECYRPELAH